MMGFSLGLGARAAKQAVSVFDPATLCLNHGSSVFRRYRYLLRFLCCLKCRRYPNQGLCNPEYRRHRYPLVLQ